MKDAENELLQWEQEKKAKNSALLKPNNTFPSPQKYLSPIGMNIQTENSKKSLDNTGSIKELEIAIHQKTLLNNEINKENCAPTNALLRKSLRKSVSHKFH